VRPALTGVIARRRSGAAFTFDQGWFSYVQVMAPLDGAGGSTFEDRSQFERTATVTGSPVISTDQARFGTMSAKFNGSSSIGYPGGLGSAASATIEFWVWVSSSSVTHTICDFMEGTGSATTIRRRHSDGVMQINISGSLRITGSTPVPLGQWAHIAITRLSGSLRLFVNGAYQGVTSSLPAFTSANVRFGVELVGHIQDARVSTINRYPSDGTGFTLPTAPHPTATGPVVAVSPTTFVTATSLNQTIPAKAATGDMLLAWVMYRSTLTPPSGWTLVRTETFIGGGFTQYLSVYERIATSSDPGASTTWTQASSARLGVHIQAFRKTGGYSVISSNGRIDSNTTSWPTVEFAGATVDAGQIAVHGGSIITVQASFPVQTSGLATSQLLIADNRMFATCVFDTGVQSGQFVVADPSTTSGGEGAISVVLG
jgi:hypothetical protein